MTSRPSGDQRGDLELTGYSDRLGAKPGETVRFMVSTSEERYAARVVRLIHGDERRPDKGFTEEHVTSDLDGSHPGRLQRCETGSHLSANEVGSAFRLRSATLQCWIAPTTPQHGRRQAVICRWCSAEDQGYGLFIDSDGHLVVEAASASESLVVRSRVRLERNTWYFAAATLDSESGSYGVHVRSLSPWDKEGLVTDAQRFRPDFNPNQLDVPFRVGAAGSCVHEARTIADSFNGKIDSPTVYSRAMTDEEVEVLSRDEGPPVDAGLYAQWRFDERQQSVSVPDGGPNGFHGLLVNMPTRAVTGRRWSGHEGDFRRVPEQYTAIHFHEDDLEDAAWSVDLEWVVPAGQGSGVYALKTEVPGLIDYLPFVVEPAEDGDPHDVLVLMPTMTYVAYANERVGDSMQPNVPSDWPPEYDPLDRYVERHPEFGKSLYDVHVDLSGVTYSSSLRPIPNLRPQYRVRILHAPRHLSGDLYLTDWLEEKGVGFDTTTDLDLHNRGLALLRKYRVLITGGHPEYWTTPMLDALEEWVEGGGRVMYLGGNGFYWVTSVHPERSNVVEVRRGIAGSRPWNSEPGELHHSTTGEPGGLWRYRGRPPNRLLGIGFAAEGADGRSVGYRRTAASYADELSWVFEGVEEDLIGDYGLIMGGAVGDEVDRIDYELGSPHETVVLASSGPLSDYYGVAQEDRIRFRGAREVGEARADMTLLTSASGGAVFSVGSISWNGSLAHNGYRNGVDRVTWNVLSRFLAPVEAATGADGTRAGDGARRPAGLTADD
ncbi:MAG: subunit beta of N,N-dimethylformamidase [Acidimicrobiaceae bacterium]|nr:subunit beta of N,N-dimethylformamidase [Acidimicrobiaceae bacterium]